MKNFKNTVKRFDIFGHPVHLHVDKKGQSHKTLCGGILSLFFLVFALGYIGNCLSKMALHRQDSNIQIISSIDLSTLKNISINQTGNFFFTLLSGTQVASKIDVLSQYLDIYFQECTLDLNAAGQCVNTRRIPVKRCTQDDFIGVNRNLTKEAIKLFQQYKNQYILCPNFTHNDGFKLFNDGSNINYQRVDLIYDVCNSSISNQCKQQWEIQAFISDLQIRVLKLYKQLDFTIYDRDPISLIIENTDVLYPILSLQNSYEQVVLYYLQFVSYQTFDDYFQFGQTSQQGYYFEVAQRSSNLKPIISYQPVHLIRVSLLLYGKQKFILRQSYTLFSVLAEVGGLMSVIITVLYNFTFPIYQYSIFKKYLKRLFYARTTNDDIFSKKSHSIQNNKSNNYLIAENGATLKQLEAEIQTHKLIKFTFQQNFMVFLSGLGDCFKCFIPNFENYRRIYKYGNERMEKEMNVIQIIKNIRYMKIIFKHLLMSPQLKYDIQHYHKNVIDIENDPPEKKSKVSQEAKSYVHIQNRLEQDNCHFSAISKKSIQTINNQIIDSNQYVRRKLQKQMLDLLRQKQDQNFQNLLDEPENYNQSKVVFPDEIMNMDQTIVNKIQQRKKAELVDLRQKSVKKNQMEEQEDQEFELNNPGETIYHINIHNYQTQNELSRQPKRATSKKRGKRAISPKNIKHLGRNVKEKVIEQTEILKKNEKFKN